MRTSPLVVTAFEWVSSRGRTQTRHGLSPSRAFPRIEKGQLTRQLADRTSDSKWHHDLVAQAARGVEETAGQRSSYWMVPFEQYKTMCPYLVGDYEQVAQLLQSYIDKGYRTFILDIPPNHEELDHTVKAFGCCEVPGD